MFRELIKLRELQRLLRRKKWIEVLELARDPAIRDHRRTLEAAERARRQLLEEAGRRHEAGELTRAFDGVNAALRDKDDSEARGLERRIRESAQERDAAARSAAREIERARHAAGTGDLAAALAVLEPLKVTSPEAARLADEIARRRERAAAAARDAQAAAAASRWPDAFGRWKELVSLDSRAGAVLPLARALLDHASGGADLEFLGQVLTATRDLRDPELPAARRGAIEGYLEAVDGLLRAGAFDAAAARLAVFPLGSELDERASTRLQGVREALLARRLYAEGDARLAEERFEAAAALLPESDALRAFLSDLQAAGKAVEEPLREARAAFAAGAFLRARTLLLDVLERQPANRDAQDLLAAVEKQEAEDLDTIRKARDLLSLGVEGSLDDCRRLLVALQARRPDLVEVPVLLRDVDRRLKEARLRLIEREAAAASPRAPAAAARALRRGPVAPREPFILRVEEHGDWFVHPGDTLVIGNSLRGAADLPVLAAIGARHARIERRRTAQGTVYAIVPEPGRSLLRNRREVERETLLQHGDVLRFGDVLGATFLRPVPASATAILRFEGDFTVHGCRQAALFDERGREGSLVLGPAPEAHVPLQRDADRVELFRASGSEVEPVLWARGPRGVAAGEGAERPQVRVEAGVPIRAGDLGFFVDPV